MDHVVFIPPIKGKEAELFGHVVSCMASKKFVQLKDLERWIKKKKGWSKKQLKTSLDKLKSQGALLQYPQGLKPITHVK